MQDDLRSPAVRVFDLPDFADRNSHGPFPDYYSHESSKIVYQRCVVTQVSCINPRIDRLRPHLQAIWIATSYHFAVSTKPINLKSGPEIHSPTEFGSSFQVSNQCMLCTEFSQSDQSRFRYRQLANMLSRGCISRYVPQTCHRPHSLLISQYVIFFVQG